MNSRTLICLLPLLLLGCDPGSGQTEASGVVNFRAVVKPDAAFVGQGLQVPEADPRWDWLLPDLDGLVRHHLVDTGIVKNDAELTYRRSYLIEDNLGFVWSWGGDGHDSYLVMNYSGENGYCARLIHNTHALTLDDLILAVVFDSEFASFLQQFEMESWVIEGVDASFDPDSLAFMGDRFFDGSDRYTLFEGRITTLSYNSLYWRDGMWVVCDTWDGNCQALPKDFNDRLEKHIRGDQGLVCIVKVSLNASGEIESVIAAEVFRWNEDDSLESLVSWPIPAGYPGAGSWPWIMSQDDSPESFDFNGRDRISGSKSG